MTLEYSIYTPITLLIVAFCICFMLNFHNIAVRQTISSNENYVIPTKIIRIADSIIDLQKGE